MCIAARMSQRMSLTVVLSVMMSGPALGDSAYDVAVELDWQRQEARLGRSPEDLEALLGLLDRGDRLIEALRAMPGAPDLSEEAAVTAQCRRVAAGFDALSAAERRDVYRTLRRAVREAALKNPLFAGNPLAFMERRRFICQMLHEYLGYYYDYGDIAGGGVYVLPAPGRSAEREDLIGARLPRGNYATLALSYDGEELYFAFAARAESGKPGFYSRERRCFHIYAMDAGGGALRRLTDGPNDDFDPCPLPDGGVAFMSTRRGGFTRCNNPWEPLPAHTLHRMDADGGNVRTLSFHETSEWHPNVLWDGRIVYTRWDYVDRSAANYHGLWVTNPDGTGTRALFGNYTERINACYQAHPVPGSRKIAFLAGAHHANVGGSLVLLDPDRLALDRDTGEDSFAAIEQITPEVCFAEAPGWPGSYYHSPWPLSEDFFLVAFSFDPLPGMGPDVKEDTETGLYLLDRFGNLELLYRNPGISAMYPIPLEPRAMPSAVTSTRDAQLGDMGEFLVSDIGASHFPMPEGRPIVSLRVFQILPKSESHVANKPRLGFANAESARMLLGTVPVDEDGSAYFRAPAGKPLAFQAVDAAGRAVQGMRSVAYVQPGERRACVGCHETVGEAPRDHIPMAMRRPPSPITPGPDGTMPWSYVRLVQPILDRHCSGCHGAGEAGGRGAKPVFAHTRLGPFNVSYRALEPYVRWYEWGDKSISRITTVPGQMPADASALFGILEDSNHAGKVALSQEERRRLYLWLDGNASFYGAYSPGEQLAQRRGQAIALPALQ